MPVLRQLPRWAWFGAAVLAVIAGMVNVVGYLGFRHEPITNMTGNTSLLGIAIGGADGREALHWGLTILAFLVGAMLSGMVVQQSTLRLGRRYGLALALESLLLFVAVPLLDASNPVGLYLASISMGLQNGMVSAYSGAVIRTSHVTGIFTDLGIYIGHWLRGLRVDMLRVRVCLVVVTGFLAGSIAGTWLYSRLQDHALLVPAVLTGLTGLGYGTLHQYQLLRQAAREEP